MSVLVPVPAEWNQCNSAKRGRSELSDRVLDKEKKTPSPSPSPKRARGGHRTESEHQKFGEITQSRWVTPSTEFWRKRSNPPKYPPPPAPAIAPKARPQTAPASAAETPLAPAPASASAAQWAICPCKVQPDPSLLEKTHTRAMRLPFAIELYKGGSGTIRGTYLGHGLSKVAFFLEDGRVLKLSALDDMEPVVFKELQRRSGGEHLCPEVYESSTCSEMTASSKPKHKWLAWIAQYTPPLSKILEMPETDRLACIISALYVLVRCAQLGLLVSDNNICNFGVAVGSGGVAKPICPLTAAADQWWWRRRLAEYDSCVVILDAGSRALQAPDTFSKGDINDKVVYKWWVLLKRQVPDWDKCKEAQSLWQWCHKIEEVFERIKHYCRVAKSVPKEEVVAVAKSVPRKEPVQVFRNAPFVQTLFGEHEDDRPQLNILDWFYTKCVFDKLKSLYVLPLVAGLNVKLCIDMRISDSYVKCC